MEFEACGESACFACPIAKPAMTSNPMAMLTIFFMTFDFDCQKKRIESDLLMMAGIGRILAGWPAFSLSRPRPSESIPPWIPARPPA